MDEVYQPEAVLETEHLVLRPLVKEDGKAIFNNINNDKEVLAYYLAPYQEKYDDNYIQWTIDSHHKNRRYCWAMVLKETSEVIGMMNQCNSVYIMMQNVEIGYAIGKKYWNKGYTTEALEAVIEFLFERGIHKVFCGHILENSASRRVMEKAGMEYEYTCKDAFYYHDKYSDVAYYSIINPAHL